MGVNPGAAAAAMDTTAGAQGKFFPGIVPAAINEASEIMAQLNTPFRTHTQFKWAVMGRQVVLTDTIVTQVTPLMLIMAVSAPAVVVAVLKILELAAGAGKALGGISVSDEAIKLGVAPAEAAISVVDDAVSGARAAGEGVVGVFGRIWNFAKDFKPPIIGVP